MTNLNIDLQRVVDELDTLAGFSATPPPGVTRIVFTDPDRKAREFFTSACQATGLTMRADAVGNLFARFGGSHPELPAVATGSHCDAIPHSGRFDGTVGVWGGLEAIRALQATGFQPRRSIELIMFTAEEPTRFGIGCLGSRLIAGVLDPDVADALTDESGRTLAATRTENGYTQPLSSTRIQKNELHAFVELHIEQGPLLEQQGKAIGVVTDIAAPAALHVDYEGTGGHAGAVLMPQRRDALIPAAELALAVDAAAREFGGPDTVATTGVLDVFPRAINSIPARTHLEIDVRDTHLPRRDRVLDHIIDQANKIGEARHQQTTISVVSQDPPAQCGNEIVKTIEQACRDSDTSYQRMISRAYHDCLFMALICPSSMIFIPCREGISHHPDEYSKPEDIAVGIEILARTLAELAT